MKGMADDVAILDNVMHGGDLLAVQDNLASLYGIFLPACCQT